MAIWVQWTATRYVVPSTTNALFSEPLERSFKTQRHRDPRGAVLSELRAPARRELMPRWLVDRVGCRESAGCRAVGPPGVRDEHSSLELTAPHAAPPTSSGWLRQPPQAPSAAGARRQEATRQKVWGRPRDSEVVMSLPNQRPRVTICFNRLSRLSPLLLHISDKTGASFIYMTMDPWSYFGP